MFIYTYCFHHVSIYRPTFVFMVTILFHFLAIKPADKNTVGGFIVEGSGTPRGYTWHTVDSGVTRYSWGHSEVFHHTCKLAQLMANLEVFEGCT